MAVNIQCSDPQALLSAIKTAIRTGVVNTWLVDEDGDFTHAPEQWKYKAWFRTNVSAERLTFNILAPRGKQLSRVVYGVYHGRFIEMLLNHFDLQFTRASATALPTANDWVDPPA